MASGISDAQLQPRGTRHKKSASDTFAFVAGKLLEEQEGRLSLLPDVGYEEGAAFQELGFEQDALLAEVGWAGRPRGSSCSVLDTRSGTLVRLQAVACGLLLTPAHSQSSSSTTTPSGSVARHQAAG